MQDIITKSNAHIEILKTRIAATTNKTAPQTRPIPTEFFNDLIPFMNRVSSGNFKKVVSFNNGYFTVSFKRRGA